MEHRMQLLLDADRLERLRQRARERGVSVAAVVRDAIDASFEDDAAARRAQAGRRLLQLASEAEPVTDEPERVDLRHEAMDAELLEKASRW
ncbi:antitoxin [Kytococcus schroeteri]|uniref:Antitoxin n=2 Tax=Kytococcus schroeteri TaxID=138300 RepID=A0A2I1PB32_9MICO|nr:antitoxin [Kytococcus schroeteri]